MADEEVGGRGSLKIRREESGLVDFSDCCVCVGGGMSSDNVAGLDDDVFAMTESLIAVVVVNAMYPRHIRSGGMI